MAKLEEMPLKIGQVIQLQRTRTDQSRLPVRLVGFLTPHAVIVTMPTMGEQTVRILDDEAVVCRAFAGRVAFGFESHVLKVVSMPFPHLYLAYPREVASVVVRKTPRLAIQREAALLKSSEQGEESRETATIVDISTTGSCAIAKPEFDNVTLLLPATKADEVEIRLPAIVRSTRASEGASGNGPVCQYGMEFVDLSAEQTHAVEKLIQEQLTQGL